MKISKETLKQIIKEELEEVSRGRQPRLQKGRPAVDDREYYDPNHLELEKEVDAMNLGDDLGKFPPDPTYEEKRAFITRINKRLQKAQDRETINKLRDLKRKIDLFHSEARLQRARRGAVRDSDRDPMFRRGVTEARLKEIIKEELENVLEGVEKAWCVGFEKDGETEHETVYADAGGIAERKIKKKHDIGDKAIKSTKEGKCKR